MAGTVGREDTWPGETSAPAGAGLQRPPPSGPRSPQPPPSLISPPSEQLALPGKLPNESTMRGLWRQKAGNGPFSQHEAHRARRAPAQGSPAPARRPRPRPSALWAKEIWSQAALGAIAGPCSAGCRLRGLTRVTLPPSCANGVTMVGTCGRRLCCSRERRLVCWAWRGPGARGCPVHGSLAIIIIIIIPAQEIVIYLWFPVTLARQLPFSLSFPSCQVGSGASSLEHGGRD